ncbi:MAG: hypothetical protein H6835_14380 [Planctomycetes bacterium]|nr:hypothetical protein [Planctomycetota bacterium]
MSNQHPKQAAEDLPFVHGPAIADPERLLPWLAAQHDGERPALVQLPVRGPDPRAELHVVQAGGDAERAAIAVRLDDAALGLALADRWKMLPSGSDPVAWLEGTWAPETTPPTLCVTRWIGGLSSAERAAPQFARRVVTADADRALVAALTSLGDHGSPAAHRRAEHDLLAGGIAALPLLVLSLDDGRAAVRDDAGAGPHAIAATVGERCEALLHRLVTPLPRELVGRGEVLGARVLEVRDWGEFWRRRSARTLAEIHAELAPLVDAYRAQHGTPQRVD